MRPIEVARHDAFETTALLRIPDERPAVPFAFGEREQHVEDERLQRKLILGVLNALHRIKLVSK